MQDKLKEYERAFEKIPIFFVVIAVPEEVAEKLSIGDPLMLKRDKNFSYKIDLYCKNKISKQTFCGYLDIAPIAFEGIENSISYKEILNEPEKFSATVGEILPISKGASKAAGPKMTVKILRKPTHID